MFPIIGIEDFYTAYKKNSIDVFSDFGPVQGLVENWLIEHSVAPKPFKSALNSLQSQWINETGFRLSYAIAMCLCGSTTGGAKIFNSYQEYIETNIADLTNLVANMNVNLGFHGVAPDIRIIFQGLNSEAFKLALKVYEVEPQDIIKDAIAWDDLDLVIKASDTNEKKARFIAFNQLAKFPVSPLSRVHQALVVTPDDEKDLFHEQVSNLKIDLAYNLNDTGLLARPAGARRSTLTPGGRSLLEKANAPDSRPIHQHPEFKHMLNRDLERNAHAFFRHSMAGMKGEENGFYADEITQAFLDAGAPPAYLIANGPCHIKYEKPSGSIVNFGLSKALQEFASMGHVNKRFYATVFRAYLKDFTCEQILEACNQPKIVAAIYRLTGDKNLLQAGNDQIRTMVMGEDLGL